MDGLFTVFGLGTAFGVFCSWLYDVIRKRNLPVSRVASFEAFHGSNVMPAPEPVMNARKEPTDANDSISTQTSSYKSESYYNDENVNFADTVSFEPSGVELPIKLGAPRVVLLVNDAVVRDVQENDLLSLMTEFNILAGSEQAQSFQGGTAVTIGNTKIQLAQA